MTYVHVAFAVVSLSLAAGIAYQIIKSRVKPPQVIAVSLLREGTRLLDDGERYDDDALVKEAAETFQRVLSLDLSRLDPSYMRACELLGCIWARQGNSDPEAMQLYEQCAHNGIETPEILRLLSYWWIEQSREDEEALYIIDKALKIHKYDEVILLHMVQKYNKLGETTKHLQCLLKLFNLGHREENNVIPLAKALLTNAQNNSNRLIDTYMLGDQYEPELGKSIDDILVCFLELKRASNAGASDMINASIDSDSTPDFDSALAIEALVRNTINENNTNWSLEPIFEQYLKTRSGDITAISHLAKIYFDNNHVEKALDMYFELIHDITENKDIVLKIADELKRQGKKDYQAFTVYSKALQINPSNNQIHQAVADTIINCQMDEKEMIPYLTNARQRFPHDIDYSRYLLHLYNKYGMFQEVIDLAGKLQSQDQDDKDTILLLANAFIMLEKSGTEVIKTCELALDLSENYELDKKLLRVLAAHYVENKSKNVQHLAIIERYLKVYPLDLEASLYLVETYFELEEYSKSEVYTDSILKEDPGNKQAMKIIAYIKQEKEGFEKAEKYWWDLFQQNADDDEILVKFSRLLAVNSQLTDEAAAVYKKVRSKHPENTESRRMLYRYSFIRKHYEEALTLTEEIKEITGSEGLPEIIVNCKEILNNDSSFAKAHFNLGLYYFEADKYYPALEKFKDVARLTNDFDDRLIQELIDLSEVINNRSEALEEIGRLYFRLKQYHKAIEVLENIYYSDDQCDEMTALLLQVYQEHLSENPEDNESSIKAAKIMVASGHYDEAVPLLQGLLRDDYNMKQVKLLLVQSYVGMRYWTAAKENLMPLIKKGNIHENLTGNFLMAIIHKEMNEIEEAIELGEKIYSVDAHCQLESNYKIKDFLDSLEDIKEKTAKQAEPILEPQDREYIPEPEKPPRDTIPGPGIIPASGFLKEMSLANIIDKLIHQKTGKSIEINNFDESKPMDSKRETTLSSDFNDEFLSDFADNSYISKNCSHLQEIGEGGMSIVYKAFDNDQRIPVVIKKLKVTSKDQQELLQRTFHGEAELLKHKLKHNNIVKIYDFFQPDILIMEYVGGKTFAEILHYLKSKSTPEDLIVIDQQNLFHCFYHICKGLDYIHNEGIIHRDIKPSNVMVNRQLEIKILDFGIAVSRHGTGYLEAGTFDYMAPEIIENPFQADPRSDIYSLGVTMYEIFTGKHPAETPDRLPIKELRRKIPADYDLIIGKMMHPDENKRFRSVKEILEKLEGIKRASPKVNQFSRY